MTHDADAMVDSLSGAVLHRTVPSGTFGPRRDGQPSRPGVARAAR